VGLEFDVVVAHYREIGLKGRNRSFFVRALVEAMTKSLAGLGAQVAPISGRVLVRPGDQQSLGEVLARLRLVFGLSGFSPAVQLHNPSMQDLCDAAVRMADASQFVSFKIRARRGHTSFPQNSGQINIAVGRAVQDHTGAKVDLSNGEWTLYIELVANKAYLYCDKVPGPGGLPMNTSGKVLGLISGGIDSPVAAWQIARRGAQMDFVHFHGQPYSDPSSSRQAEQLVHQLLPWLLETNLWKVPFGDIQSEIVTTAPQQLRIVLYRRFMMRIAQALALREGAQALVTGEALGQVASQTLTNLAAVDQVVTLPVLRPLAGADKIEIEQAAMKIGTYEISIQAHQDCCVLFEPRQVTTAAKTEDLEAAEASLDIPALIDKALANAEVVEKSYVRSLERGGG